MIIWRVLLLSGRLNHMAVLARAVCDDEFTSVYELRNESAKTETEGEEEVFATIQKRKRDSKNCYDEKN